MALDKDFAKIIDNTVDGYGTIVSELLKPGAENMICPAWCKILQGSLSETRKLIKTCKILNDRLNARAKNAHSSIISSMSNARARKKVRSGYNLDNIYRGSIVDYKSN